MIFHAAIHTVCTYVRVIIRYIHTLVGALDKSQITLFCKDEKISKARMFTLHVLDDSLCDIVEGCVWYCNRPIFLFLGPNKIGTVLGTCSSGASESACPLILSVEGK